MVRFEHTPYSYNETGQGFDSPSEHAVQNFADYIDRLLVMIYSYTQYLNNLDAGGMHMCLGLYIATYEKFCQLLYQKYIRV